MKKIHFVASGSDGAQKALSNLISSYGNHPLETAEQIVVLGGDGTMLGAIHTMLKANISLPIYGINHGTLGFLLNEPNASINLPQRLDEAHISSFHPLLLEATHRDGSQSEVWAVNDVCASRMGAQAIRLEVSIDHEIRLPFFSGDGMIVSTDLGSTAYNRSAHGPIIPLGANILALTPICAFQPVHFRGALLHKNSIVDFKVIDGEYRKGFFAADNQELHDVVSARVQVDWSKSFSLQFDPGESLNMKRLKEQFLM